MKRWLGLVLAVVLFAGIGWGVPYVKNNWLVLNSQDESTFPSAPPRGALLYGADAGAVYVGNGTIYQPIGSVALGPYGTSPNANGASVSGTTLTLQPADGTHPGGLQVNSYIFGSGVGVQGGDQVEPPGSYIITQGTSSGSGTGGWVAQSTDGLAFIGCFNYGSCVFQPLGDPVNATPAALTVFSQRNDAGAVLWNDGLARSQFPPCNASTQSDFLWELNDGGYWQCRNGVWEQDCTTGGVCGGANGPFVDFVSNQTASGNKTWAGDAGFASNVTIAGDAGVLGNELVAGDLQGRTVSVGGPGVQVFLLYTDASMLHLYSGGNDFLTVNDGTGIVNFPFNATIAGNGIATTVNGRAGDCFCGYEDGTVIGHSLQVTNAQRLQHPIVAGSGANGGRMNATIISTGTISGTFDQTLVDTTTSTTLCSRTGIACNASVGLTGGNCSGGIGGAAAGDDVELRTDFTNCAGTNPRLNACVCW